jgi:hypothetical protein
LGAKRTCPFALHMSAYDPKRTLDRPLKSLVRADTMVSVLGRRGRGAISLRLLLETRQARGR